MMIAVCCALQDCIERADAAHIAPQMVGPKLLKALNNLAQFTLVPEAAALLEKSVIARAMR